MRTKRVVPASRGAMDQDREPGLIEDVHPVVAGDRVRPDANSDSRRNQWQERSDAVPELGVRCRAVSHRATVAGHDCDVFRIDTHTVNQEWAALERAPLLEERDCGSRARRDGNPTALPTLRKVTRAKRDEVDLGLTLGDVHCEGQLARVGEACRGIVQRIGDRIRRVWGDAEHDELGLLAQQRFDAVFKLSHRDLGLRRIGAEYLLVHDPAHAGIAHRLHHDPARACIGVSGDSRLDSFDNAKARGIEQRFPIHDLVPALAQPVDPLCEPTVLEKAAHRGELEVGMRVDQTGEQDRFAEVVVVTRRRGGAWANVGDHSVGLDDGSVLYRRLGDWKHPTRVIAHQRGTRSADGIVSVRRRTESRRRLSARRRLSRRRI